MHKNYILAGPLKAILDGHKVEVIKTLKANGENVQVSWNDDVEAWVICSKNVGLIAQHRDDIDKYRSDRFVFAREMAHVWFDILEEMKNEDPQLVTKLKAEMKGNTMIGEYIGAQEHQHLVKYSRVTIIFYAIVSNASNEMCWPCEKSFAFFDKFGFDKVHIKSLGLFSDFDQMCETLCQTFKDVAKSEIAENEEGNVLYFLKRSKDGYSDKVLSLCKLKTLEYRLFRKMREKLRNFYDVNRQSDAPSSEIVKRFTKEAKELLAENDLPRPLQYYIELFRTAFEFIDSNPKQNIHLLQTEYVTFSEKLLAYFCKVFKDSTFANQSSFFYSDILNRQNDIHYAGFGKSSATPQRIQNPRIQKEVQKVDKPPQVTKAVPVKKQPEPQLEM